MSWVKSGPNFCVIGELKDAVWCDHGISIKGEVKPKNHETTAMVNCESFKDKNKGEDGA